MIVIVLNLVYSKGHVIPVSGNTIYELYTGIDVGGYTLRGGCVMSRYNSVGFRKSGMRSTIIPKLLF